MEEPGRRIVKEELASGGNALPWIDAAAFTRKAVAMALADRRAAGDLTGWVFFDRGLIDAASALESITGEAGLDLMAERHRYHRRVFLAPPWPEIYVNDPERRHGLEAALPEYERLRTQLPDLGYKVLFLQKVSVADRADFILAALDDL